MTIAGILPAVAGDAIRPADPAGRQHHRLGAEQFKASPLAIVADCTGDAITVLEQRYDRALHVHIDRLIHGVILQRANDLEAGAIADVSKSRIFVATEVALKD